MKKLKVNLKNCYGIKKLEHEFDFSSNTHAIYAGNGMMKTSFARTFNDLSKGEDSKDLMHPEIETVREIVDEMGNSINKDQVFVMEPYKREYESGKISTLLVKKELKDKYDKIYLEINIKKSELLKKLKPLSGVKNGIDEELSETFDKSKKDFFICLEILEKEILNEKPPEFADLNYGEIFNEKVHAFLNNENNRQKLNEYIKTYNDIISSSTYFKQGIFNHYNASIISKNLNDNGFFAAKHSVCLNTEKDKTEISTQIKLDKLIKEEKDKILNNPDLNKRFDAIDIQLSKNEPLRIFREYIHNNHRILTELTDLNAFKKKLWISYLKKERDTFIALLELYRSGKIEIEKIIINAKSEKTAWEEVVNIFNDRFFVPFRLKIENKEDVILKNDAPFITFTFEDSNGKIGVKEDVLLDLLSTGERRALYILNIIFEVEARKKESTETLFIIDDIADSFDYKNKYAIIEYLKGISKEGIFHSIILTHNFDFYRTLENRHIVKYKNCYMVKKSDKEVKLIDASYIINPFVVWKEHLESKNEMLIASIPFVRNLIEYTKGKGDTDYIKLTSMLHIMSDSESITISNLKSIYNSVLNKALPLDDGDNKVIDLIFKVANDCSVPDEIASLENKIVLSIGIRLKAEKYMINKINDPSKTMVIKSSQTQRLFELFKKEFSGEKDSIKILEQVNLMTPENIHLNSFMYEPILDMSDFHLKDLYSNVKGLT
ncbi:hypothetical protein METP3_02315 [Methanosarcinales archaeon]|nr:hypothetical protein METP3_02315 [Methanosarcinales archaeon]